MSAILVLTALGSAKEAEKLAVKAVREKKAACVTVVPGAVSHYRWKGKLHRTSEALLFIKTAISGRSKLLAFLRKNHPYEVPEILTLQTSQVSKSYLAWLKASIQILCLVFAGSLFTADLLWAKDSFVKYSEVQDLIAAGPRDGSLVTAEELRGLQQTDPSLRIYDARPMDDFKKERISGASLPMTEEYYRLEALFRLKIVKTAPDRTAALRQGAGELPKSTAIVTYCNRNCGLSKQLMKELQALGFSNVRYLAGGIDSWREKGYPLESQDLKK